MNQTLVRAKNAIESGEKKDAVRLLTDVIKASPKSKDAEEAYLWLSKLLEDPEKKRKCLNAALAINPNNRIAKNELSRLSFPPKIAPTSEIPKASDIAAAAQVAEASVRIEPAAVEPEPLEDFNIQTRPAAKSINWKIWIGLGIALFVLFICLASALSKSLQSNSGLFARSKPTSTPVPAKNLPPTYTPLSQPSSNRPAVVDSAQTSGDCSRAASSYANRISDTLYLFAKTTELGYEVTSDIAMIPIIIELEDLREEFAGISPPACVNRSARTISNGMDTVIESVSGFAYGEIDAASATITVHSGAQRMLDGFDEILAVSETAVQPTTRPTRRPTNTPYPTKQRATPTPVATPVWVILPTVTLTPIRQISGNEAEFKSYLRNTYSSIGGIGLVIEEITIHNEGGTYPHRAVSIELSSDSARNVFGVQPGSVALQYGERLLSDVSAYFGGQDCMVRVFEFFYDDYLSDRYFDDDWYYIGSYYVDDGWGIQKDYVIGHMYGGSQSLQVWNAR